MAQHDYVIANGDGASVRADINNLAAAIATLNSGSSAPSTLYQGQPWVDTNTPSATEWTIYIYDGTDHIALGTLDTTANVFKPYPDATQTLTNKTLTSPTLTTPTLSGDVTLAATQVMKHGATAAGTSILNVQDGNTRNAVIVYAGSDGVDPNAANAVLKVRQASGTGRSINASGTVNASGADYAEYLRKREDCGEIAKGDICGIDADGLLTDRWEHALRFCVKSTRPNLVGGDTWGDAAGERPQPPEPADDEAPVAERREHGRKLKAFEADLKGWEARHEAERKKVDRVAFCGIVPCNVAGAEPGDYIVPVAEGGGIAGKAVKEPTFEEYRIAVGRVHRILADGRAEVVVKPI